MIEQAPDLNKMADDLVKDTAATHSQAIPGIKPKEDGATPIKVEMTPTSYDKLHNVVNVKVGNYEIKTFRKDENGNRRIVEDRFLNNEGQVFWEPDLFYVVSDSTTGRELGPVSFTQDQLNLVNEQGNSTEVQKMVMEKALRVQVEAADKKAEEQGTDEQGTAKR